MPGRFRALDLRVSKTVRTCASETENAIDKRNELEYHSGWTDKCPVRRSTYMFEKILQIMEEQLGIDTAGVTEETTFREDLRIDSLDLYELVTALEDEYGIEIQPEELDEIKSIGDVIAYLASKGIE